MDPERRDALNQVVVDLRGETREALDRFAADLRGEIQTSAASLLQQMRETESGMRRHFDVVGESLRSDSRVLRLEVRVTDLEGGRKPRRPRRRQ